MSGLQAGDLSGMIASYAITYSASATELVDHHLAGPFALVAHHSRTWIDAVNLP
jgi:hypothetical protein